MARLVLTDQPTEFPTKLNQLPPDTRQQARETRKARKVFAAVFSPFVRAMTECMAAYREARAQGLERADAAKGIELVLRDTWPKATTKFGPTCQACEDTGYQEHICRPYVRCGLRFCESKGEAWQHPFVTPCDCVKGQRYARRGPEPEQAAESLGKVSKAKKGWRQVGA